MNQKIVFVSLTLLCAASLIVLSACSSPVGTAAPISTPTPTSTTTPTISPVTGPKIGFEGAQVSDLLSATGLAANWADFNETWDTSSAVSNDMTFSVDSGIFDTGAASLKISATAHQNKYSTTQAGWVAVLDLTKVAGLETPIDLTGKTVSFRGLIPTGSGLTGLKLIFLTATDQSQGKVVAIPVKDSWTTVSYLFGEPSDYTSAGFDITQVTGLSLSAVIDPASANATGAIAFVDSLTW